MSTHLFDSAVSLQLDLNRIDAQTRATVIEILRKMERELVAQLSDGNLTDWKKSKINKLLSESRAVIDGYYSTIQSELFDLLDGVAGVTVKDATKAIGQVMVSVTPSLPTQAVMAELASGAFVQGALTADWWSRQSMDSAWRFDAAIRQGIVAGEANGKIIARVREGMAVSRANAAALVQTAVQTVSNRARSAVSEANSDLIKSQMWLTALDSHVCPRCAARADLKWDMQTKKPIGHGIPYELPPIHYNDRCILVDVTKTYREMGIDLDEPKEGTRASDEGQVAGDMTFDAFLKRKGVDYQNDVLGKGKAELWRDKKITLQQLIDGNGNPLTLKQLQAKYD